jgi:hypothetical protein
VLDPVPPEELLEVPDVSPPGLDVPHAKSSAQTGNAIPVAFMNKPPCRPSVGPIEGIDITRRMGAAPDMDHEMDQLQPCEESLRAVSVTRCTGGAVEFASTRTTDCARALSVQRDMAPMAPHPSRPALASKPARRP